MRTWVAFLVCIVTYIICSGVVLADTNTTEDIMSKNARVAVDKGVAMTTSSSAIYGSFYRNENTEIEEQDLVLVEKVEERYRNLFFDSKVVSEKEFLVDIEVKKDPESNDLTTYVVSGTVNNIDGISVFDKDMIILMMYYFDNNDGTYKKLCAIDENSENILEGVLLFYAKVNLQIKENNIRIIAFRKSEREQLQLDKNLQISDYKVDVKDMSFIERVENTIKAIFKLEKDVFRKR